MTVDIKTIKGYSILLKRNARKHVLSCERKNLFSFKLVNYMIDIKGKIDILVTFNKYKGHTNLWTSYTNSLFTIVTLKHALHSWRKYGTR